MLFGGYGGYALPSTICVLFSKGEEGNNNEYCKFST